MHTPTLEPGSSCSVSWELVSDTPQSTEQLKVLKSLSCLEYARKGVKVVVVVFLMYTGQVWGSLRKMMTVLHGL